MEGNPFMYMYMSYREYTYLKYMLPSLSSCKTKYLQMHSQIFTHAKKSKQYEVKLGVHMQQVSRPALDFFGMNSTGL